MQQFHCPSCGADFRSAGEEIVSCPDCYLVVQEAIPDHFIARKTESPTRPPNWARSLPDQESASGPHLDSDEWEGSADTRRDARFDRFRKKPSHRWAVVCRGLRTHAI